MINLVIKSQVSYCPLLWMLCSHSLNNSLDHKHEHGLMLNYNDYVQSFQDILEITNQKTIHKKTLECIAMEIYKFLYGLSPSIMNDVLQVRKTFVTLKTSSHLTLLAKKLSNLELNVTYN